MDFYLMRRKDVAIEYASRNDLVVACYIFERNNLKNKLRQKFVDYIHR